MRLTRRGLVALPAAALALAGWTITSCGPTAGPQPQVSTPAASRVELTEVTYQGLDAAVKEQTGKVVLIDVWFRA
jgi:hypothetical protein